GTMSQATRTEVEPTSSTDGSLDYLLAGALAAAAIIHVAMVPTHAAASLLDGSGFAAAAWFPLRLAGPHVAGRPRSAPDTTAAVGNAIILALYVVSRTVGLPVGGHEGIVEEVGAIDGLSALLEVSAVILSLYLLVAPASKRISPLPALAGLAVLGLATAAIV